MGRGNNNIHPANTSPKVPNRHAQPNDAAAAAARGSDQSPRTPRSDNDSQSSSSLSKLTSSLAGMFGSKNKAPSSSPHSESYAESNVHRHLRSGPVQPHPNQRPIDSLKNKTTPFSALAASGKLCGKVTQFTGGRGGDAENVGGNVGGNVNNQNSVGNGNNRNFLKQRTRSDSFDEDYVGAAVTPAAGPKHRNEDKEEEEEVRREPEHYGAIPQSSPNINATNDRWYHRFGLGCIIPAVILMLLLLFGIQQYGVTKLVKTIHLEYPIGGIDRYVFNGYFGGETSPKQDFDRAEHELSIGSSPKPASISDSNSNKAHGNGYENGKTETDHHIHSKKDVPGPKGSTVSSNKSNAETTTTGGADPASEGDNKPNKGKSIANDQHNHSNLVNSDKKPNRYQSEKTASDSESDAASDVTNPYKYKMSKDSKVAGQNLKDTGAEEKETTSEMNRHTNRGDSNKNNEKIENIRKPGDGGNSGTKSDHIVVPGSETVNQSTDIKSDSVTDSDQTTTSNTAALTPIPPYHIHVPHYHPDSPSYHPEEDERRLNPNDFDTREEYCIEYKKRRKLRKERIAREESDNSNDPVSAYALEMSLLKSYDQEYTSDDAPVVRLSYLREKRL